MQTLVRVVLVAGGLFMALSSRAADEPVELDGSPPSNEARLLSGTRQLIFEGRRSGEGYFSADGSQLVFQSEREPGNPFYQIYVMDLETGDTRRVSTGAGKSTCAWLHPAGDRVLFATTHADPRAKAKQDEELQKRAAGKASRYSWSFDEHYDIYEAQLDGGQLRNLTNSPGYDAEGSWSPDGRLIAFASNRHAYDKPLSEDDQKIFEHDKSYFMDIYLMAADGTGLRRLTDSPGYDGGPFFSPDGRRLVWRRFSRDGALAEVWTMNADGSDKRQITHLQAMSWAPFYHPSGDYIIFATNRHGFANFELYLVDSAGEKEPIRVTNTEGFDGLPVFSPEGGRLSWTSTRTPDRKAQIFLADWNDKEARLLLELSPPRRRADTAPAVPDLDASVARIRAEDLRTHVQYLASEKLGGRLTGTEGERLATEYVAAVFRHLGLEPAGEAGSFFQTYEFTAGVSLGADNRLTVTMAGAAEDLGVDVDWRPLPFTVNGDVPVAGVVFAGYGIAAPATDRFPAYDAYQGLDVAGKWVLVFRYLPEEINAEHRQHLSNYSSLRYKSMLARDKGARGLIVVSGPNAKVKDPLVKLGFDAVPAESGLAVVSVSDRIGERLLQGTGKTLQGVQDALDTGESVAGMELPRVTLQGRMDVRQEKRTARNVLSRLSAAVADKGPPVVLGAHVDHIGDGVGLDSRAEENGQGQVHPGADDNASGVAGMLEIAQHLADQRERGKLPLERDIVFAAWTGEEVGLLGSGHYVRTLSGAGEAGERPLEPYVSAYLNLDMIGRLDKSLYLQGMGSSAVWSGELERRNAPVGLSVVPQEDSYLPTDATSFYLKGVPVLSAFTGAHAEYNTPRDTPDSLNYEGAARIARLMGLLTRAVATSASGPDYIAMEKPAATASRRNLRAYLGTIPEYGDTGVQGVRLSGVAKGGPADRGGLRGGDVIVELAGRKIENIYDYTYALNAAKVGQPVEITVDRGAERVSLTVTPDSRE